MVDMGLVADHQFERGIDLVVDRGTLVALDQHGAGVFADDDQGAREDRRWPCAGIGEHQVQRPRQRRAVGDPDYRAIAHEGGVECDRDIIGRYDLAEVRGDGRVAGRQRLRRRADRKARLEPGQVRKFRHQHAVDKHHAARFDRGEFGAGVLGTRLRGSVGHAGQRVGRAHQRAQVGVLPFLHPPVRQAGGFEPPERLLAQRSDHRRAG